MVDKENILINEQDIIDKLCGDIQLPKMKCLLKRLNIAVELTALTEKEINKITKECTKTKRLRGGQNHKELDGPEFMLSLIEKATIVPNWNNDTLISKFNASSGKQVIKNVLLSGEIENLAEQVLELSGYNETLDEIEDIKN